MSRPLAVRRHDEILRRLRAAGSVGVAELAEALGVSHETVRRDLKLLAGQGYLDIVHGGASLRGPGEGPRPATARPDDDEGAAAIARVAMRLVPDAATVLIDAGAATGAIARALVSRRGLTVCTNSLAVAVVLCHVPGNRVYMLGGEIDPKTESTFGVDVLRGVENLRCDVAFVGVASFTDEGEPTAHSRGAAEMRGQMILTGPAYLVAERGSLDERSPFRVPHFDRVAGVVVDSEPAAALRRSWAKRDLDVLVAS